MLSIELAVALAAQDKKMEAKADFSKLTTCYGKRQQEMAKLRLEPFPSFSFFGFLHCIGVVKTHTHTHTLSPRVLVAARSLFSPGFMLP